MTDKTPENHSRKKLLEIFSLVNMDSLPAMSDHTMDLLSLLGNSQVSAQELSEAILKDYALTTKILQVVNSAYYSRGTPISTISRAVTVVGFDTLRQLASTMALFEEFSAAGTDKDTIAAEFAQSLISATQSSLYCTTRMSKISSEEAYLCSLLHRLGRMIVLVYLPRLYQAVEEHIEMGYSEEHSAKIILNGLTYNQIGKEIGTFWNFSKRLVSCMDGKAVRPGKSKDPFLYLHNTVLFSNYLTEAYFKGNTLAISELILQYGPILDLDQEAAFELFKQSIEICENYSTAMRNGLNLLKQGRSREITVTKDHTGRWVRLS